MLRSRFLLTAAVAVATALVAPAVSQATFSVTISTSDAGGPATAIVYDNNPVGSPGPNVGPFIDRNGNTAKSIDISSDQGGDYNGITLGITTKTNSPGTAVLGQVTETQLSLTNNDANSAKNVRIEIASSGFLSPNTPQLYLQTIVSALGGQLPDWVAAGMVSITSVVTPPGSPDAATHNTFTQGTGGDSDKWFSDKPLFDASTPYTITTIIDITLSKAGSADGRDSIFFNAKANVTPTPAPAGLVMLAGVVPFFGFLRRRLRKSEVATVA
jgi:hypothetical protein